MLNFCLLEKPVPKNIYIYIFFLATLWRMELHSQGSDRSLSRDLSHSGDNTGSCGFHSASPRIEPMSQHSQDITNPIAPQQELQFLYILNGCRCQIARVPNWIQLKEWYNHLFLSVWIYNLSEIIFFVTMYTLKKKKSF